MHDWAVQWKNMVKQAGQLCPQQIATGPFKMGHKQKLMFDVYVLLLLVCTRLGDLHLSM